MKTSIIIPNWNGLKLLKKNLPAVLEAKKISRNNILEIIIVDDYSTDDSVSFIQKTFKNKVRLIKHKKNMGFAAAVNTGARHAKGQLLCLLNTDVVPSKNFLLHVTPHFHDPKLFAVVLHEKGSGPATGTFKNGFLSHRGAPESSVSVPSLWASGGSSVFQRKLWWDLKGLDEKLFKPFYWEDVDLSYRAWKRGYKIIWEPLALVEHKHEGTINTNSFQKKYMDRVKERNELLFLWKNITSEALWRKHIVGVANRIISHPGYLKIVLLALKKRSLVAKKRYTEKKETNVSDEAIFTIFNS